MVKPLKTIILCFFFICVGEFCKADEQKVVILVGIDTKSPIQEATIRDTLFEFHGLMRSLLSQTGESERIINVLSDLDILVFGFMDVPVVNSAGAFSLILSEAFRIEKNFLSERSRMGRFFSISRIFKETVSRLSRDQATLSRKVRERIEKARILLSRVFSESIERPLIKEMLYSENGVLAKIKRVMTPLAGFLELKIVENATRSDLADNLWSDQSLAVFWIGHGSIGTKTFLQKMVDSNGDDVTGYFSKVGKNLRYLGLVSCGALSTVESVLREFSGIPDHLKISGSNSYSMPNILLREFYMMFRHLDGLSGGAWRSNKSLYQYLALETNSLADAIAQGFFGDLPSSFPNYEISDSIKQPTVNIQVELSDSGIEFDEKISLVLGNSVIGVWSSSNQEKPIKVSADISKKIESQGLSVERLNGSSIPQDVSYVIHLDGVSLTRWEDSNGLPISDGFRQMYFMR